MRHLKNQQGYALLIVLLIVVLFLSMAATFIAGSLNHAKQEQTVDVTNHAVAAAEMGTLYFTSDFERELKMLKQEMGDQTQLKLNVLIDCIKYPLGSACDTEAERVQWENKIDNEMKSLYIERIMAKVEELNQQIGIKSVPFSAEQIDYSILGMNATQMNAGKEDVASASVTDKEVTSIEIEMEVQGASEDILRQLVATFYVSIPDSFLNADESIKVDTILITNDEDLTYEKIFTLVPPTKSCTALIEEVINNTATAPYECAAASGESLSNLIQSIKSKNLDPTDFRVYTNDFKDYVCDGNCNNLNFEGISLVVQENDAAASNNMNNLINANLIINGKLDAGNNLINLGKNGVKQTIIVKELTVDVNIKNMYYTNFLILGYNQPVENPKVAHIEWKNHIEISNYSRLCIDIDRIDSADLKRLGQEIEFSESGALSYFTTDPNKKFELKTTANADRTVNINGVIHKMTDVYVQREDTYTTFLENCGVVLKNTSTLPLDVSVPNPIDTDIDLEIEY